MTLLAMTLVTIGIADIISGQLAATPGTPKRQHSIWLSLLLSLATAAIYQYLSSDWVVSFVFFGVLFPGMCLWLIGRLEDSHRWQSVALISLFVTILATAFVIPLFIENVRLDWLQKSLHSLPWKQLEASKPDHVILLVGMIFFLASTSNGIVRCCLRIVRTTPVSESEQTFKGGRLIGPLERLLIFGLALSGEPTAAALIISAKSIIRFPELQSKSVGSNSGQNGVATDKEGKRLSPLIDELTEYFLLGSLLSWSLALLAAIPFL